MSDDPLAMIRGTRQYRGELDLALALLQDIKEIAKDGLNADSGDEEREALAEIGTLVGLESDFDEEADMWRYE